MPSIWSIMNKQAINDLKQENMRHPDKAEGQRRNELLDEIYSNLFDRLADYQRSIRDYEYQRKLGELKSCGILFLSAKKSNLEADWDRFFGSRVSRHSRRRTPNYSDDFRWHLFSFRLLPAAEGDAARARFDEQEKQTLYLFSQCGALSFRIENANTLSAKDLDTLQEFICFKDSDLFLYPPDGGWTYVLTHECELGPYFYQGQSVAVAETL